ncbi:MAG: glycosyltransferase family 4 protein [Candidatus Omnitrophica bacterium]|nr:glycosyltransferase family 4 protein [Candidatus Omnitrophota bacterium]
MKIAYVYDGIYPYLPGGAEKRFWELARRMVKRGHEVHLFGGDIGLGYNTIEKEGVFIHPLRAPLPRYNRKGKRSLSQVFQFSFCILFSLWKYRFDIIDTNAFPYLSFFPLKFYSFFTKTPLVSTWQELWKKYWFSYAGFFIGLFGMFCERMVLCLSQNIVVHSHSVWQQLKPYCSKKKLVLIPNGIDIDYIEEVKPAGSFYDIIFVGRLIKEKNIDILLKAFALVVKQRSESSCLIVGAGPEQSALEQLAEELEIKDRVNLRHFSDYKDVIAAMKAAKVFVFLSIREGFGIAVIEAMAAGLPVIAVHAPLNASAELIDDSKNGFLVCLEPEQIAQKILELLEDEEKRKRFGLWAKEKVKKFDFSVIVEQTEQLYKQVSLHKRN